ncbi:unnamed protein product [Polarella glacialis]|uniref:Secreted protein n=1 Tax=Polarella glacialis TaxID=89957 RepID=A0A813JHZ9_POLGL|nr:unnamed protein product [Polarella glacialis]
MVAMVASTMVAMVAATASPPSTASSPPSTAASPPSTNVQLSLFWQIRVGSGIQMHFWETCVGSVVHLHFWETFFPTHAFKPPTPEASVTTTARKEPETGMIDMLGIRYAPLTLSERLGKTIRSLKITMQTGKFHNSEKEKEHVVFT